jgi:hypothetical protein
MQIFDAFKNYSSQLLKSFRTGVVQLDENIEKFPHRNIRAITALGVLGHGMAIDNTTMIVGGGLMAIVNAMADTLNEKHYSAANKVHRFYADCGVGIDSFIREGYIVCNKACQFGSTIMPIAGGYLMFQDNKLGSLLFFGPTVAKGVHYMFCGDKRKQETKERQQEAKKLGL